MELVEEAEKLIEDIFKFRKEKHLEEFTILDVLIEYSYQKEIPLQELGDLISEHTKYVEIIKKMLIKDGYFKEDSNNLEFEFNNEEW